MKTYPTRWQQKIMWSALTALAIVCFGVLTGYGIYYTCFVVSFLQPVLLPVAVAAILAYLLDPIVEKVCAQGVARTKAVLYVFALVLLPMVLIFLWVIPELYHQSLEFGGKIPEYVDKGRQFVMSGIERFQERYASNPYVQEATQEATKWLQEQLPNLPPKIWKFLSGSAQGFLGVFGYLIGFLLVPICLFFFLKDAATISRRWSDYLPLRSSAFKDEVVSCLTEINGYLIAFFRGQLLVSLIDGVLTGIALLIMGLNFGLLIGLMVGILALIPYLGVILCWIPAVIIAAVQWHDWQHPLAVTVIFIVVQQFEGWFIAPKVVGGAVGLHPLTVIVSVFAWGLLIGGLLGAILAIPLTATLKVLLKRYIWDKRFKTKKIAQPPMEALADG